MTWHIKAPSCHHCWPEWNFRPVIFCCVSICLESFEKLSFRFDWLHVSLRFSLKYTWFVIGVGSPRSISTFRLFHMCLRFFFSSSLYRLRKLTRITFSFFVNIQTFPCRYFLPSNFQPYFFESSLPKKSCQRLTVHIPFKRNHKIMNVVPSFFLSCRASHTYLWTFCICHLNSSGCRLNNWALDWTACECTCASLWVHLKWTGAGLLRQISSWTFYRLFFRFFFYQTFLWPYRPSPVCTFFHPLFNTIAPEMITYWSFQ